MNQPLTEAWAAKSGPGSHYSKGIACTPHMVPPALQAKHALASSPARNERTGLDHLAYDALTAKACAELFDIIDHKLNLAAKTILFDG